MKALLPVLLAGALFAAPASAQKMAAKKTSTTAATATASKLEPQLSTLGWVGKKVTGQHNGSVDFKEGEVLVKGNQVTGGTFVVDMTTL